MLAAVVAASFAVLVGCTSTSGGTPGPATTTGGAGTSTKASEPTSSGDVPPITGPELDLGKVSGPCDLLKSDQLAARGITKPGTEKADHTGPTCRLEPDDRGSGTRLGVTIMSKADGLTDAYANRDQFPVFEPTEVAGYPAVSTDLTDGKHGECTTAVLVAEGKAFMVQVAVNDLESAAYTTPCSVSSEVAAIVVGNLKG